MPDTGFCGGRFLRISGNPSWSREKIHVCFVVSFALLRHGVTNSLLRQYIVICGKVCHPRIVDTLCFCTSCQFSFVLCYCSTCKRTHLPHGKLLAGFACFLAAYYFKLWRAKRKAHLGHSDALHKYWLAPNVDPGESRNCLQQLGKFSY